MNFSDLEAYQESTNEQACNEAFIEAHPNEPIINASECDSGSWSCTNCPWKDVATLHSYNNKTQAL